MPVSRLRAFRLAPPLQLALQKNPLAVIYVKGKHPIRSFPRQGHWRSWSWDLFFYNIKIVLDVILLGLFLSFERIARSSTNNKYAVIWKVLRVSSVFKSGDKTDTMFYSPITLLSNFAKIFESIIANILSHYLVNMIAPQQHGFVKGKSTITNPIEFTHFTSKPLHERFQVDDKPVFHQKDKTKTKQKLLPTRKLRLFRNFLKTRVFGHWCLVFRVPIGSGNIKRFRHVLFRTRTA